MSLPPRKQLDSTLWPKESAQELPYKLAPLFWADSGHTSAPELSALYSLSIA